MPTDVLLLITLPAALLTAHDLELTKYAARELHGQAPPSGKRCTDDAAFQQTEVLANYQRVSVQHMTSPLAAGQGTAN